MKQSPGFLRYLTDDTLLRIALELAENGDDLAKAEGFRAFEMVSPACVEKMISRLQKLTKIGL